MSRGYFMILLANYRKGGLEGEALQIPIFPVLVVGNADHEHRENDILRGPAAPATPAGEYASSIISC
jgi:hypothetical protein